MSAWEPVIVAFFCNWCTYAAADLAGVGRMQYPANIRVIRLPCSGRMSPKFILAALMQGADGVWVSGCHPGDCHYISGNYYARRKFALLTRLLTFMGVEPDRVRFSWISSAESTKFIRVVNEVTEHIRMLGPSDRFVKHPASHPLEEAAS
ncbi:heterodisulfide reductase subunit D [Desulfosarcina alkanivorans]|uniref:Heterodisulfide reductase subunit D n=1 Tax=Desulfosarcina alkanivorans TaxID=571177 RepID=A0A5K7YJP6_9BACT|nr:hydrogenase iron-sulfur subunit [Desulfosarcina alkanivorans]BBO68625.1 heterodisulfide reductase subunit D [Desulfosarcina alkanivorans]